MTTTDARKRIAEKQAAPVARIYVAGPMTGYPEFHWAAGLLASAGLDPITPARAAGREDCREWLDYMRASLHDLAACDGVATLTGWQDSRGAALEVHIARSLDLPVHPVGEWVERFAPAQLATSQSPTSEVAA